MKVDIYVSEQDRSLPRYGFLPPHRPVTLLPGNGPWRFVRSGDTSEFHLPEAVEEEIERRGCWAHTFGEVGWSVRGSEKIGEPARPGPWRLEPGPDPI
jgi:hypothetical protein